MFWNKKNKPHEVTSILGKDIKINGNIQLLGGLQIDGQVVGNIRSSESQNVRTSVSLHKQGKVCGDINAPFQILDGEIEGNVICQKFLVIEKNCRITGDVHYQSMNMAPGAVITGRIRHIPGGLLIEHQTKPATEDKLVKPSGSPVASEAPATAERNKI